MLRPQVDGDLVFQSRVAAQRAELESRNELEWTYEASRYDSLSSTHNNNFMSV